MENNTTVAAMMVCDLPSWYGKVTRVATYTQYNILAPIFTVLSLVGFLFTLIVLAKQIRFDQAYYYQLFLAVSQLLEALTLSMCMFAIDWAGLDTPGQLWYQKSYTLMWFMAHMAIPLNQTPMTVSLYLAISMSVDRLFALIKPVHYRVIDRRRHQYVALVLSCVIGAGSSIYNAFLFNVGWGDGRYVPMFNMDFAGSEFGRGMTALANFVRIFGLVALVTSNLMLIRMFRKRSSKVAMMVADSNDRLARRRRSRERTLIVLTFCESAFCSIKGLSECVFYTMAYTPNWPCYDDLGVPILDVFLQLASLADVLAPFIVSRQMRNAAQSICKWFPVTQSTTST